MLILIQNEIVYSYTFDIKGYIGMLYIRNDMLYLFFANATYRL